MTKDYRISYAQNREDILLSGFLKDVHKGFYIDIGANDPAHDSVTKYFYDQGWYGINVEPIAHLWAKLEKERPRDVNLNIGIALKRGELNFREYPRGNGLSTFSESMQKAYEDEADEHTKGFKEYNVRTLPLKDVLLEHCSVNEIHFMKVDVEGYEYNVLASNDWERFRPWVICIEANHINKDWRPLLDRHRYSHAWFDGVNDYYVANEKKNLTKSFSYVQTMLSKPVVSIGGITDAIDHKSKQLIHAQYDLKKKEMDIYHLKHQVNHLNSQLSSSRRIRTLLKDLAKAIHSAVMVYIEHLNKPRVRKMHELNINTGKSEDMMQIIRTHDMKAFYTTKRDERLLYRVVKGVYLGAANLTLQLLRFIKNKTKKLRGIGQ